MTEDTVCLATSPDTLLAVDMTEPTDPKVPVELTVSATPSIILMA